jgi:hypothetical protein
VRDFRRRAHVYSPASKPVSAASSPDQTLAVQILCFDDKSNCSDSPEATSLCILPVHRFHQIVQNGQVASQVLDFRQVRTSLVTTRLGDQVPEDTLLPFANFADSLPALFHHVYKLTPHSRHRPSSQRSSLGQRSPTTKPSLKHPLPSASSIADLGYDSTLGRQAPKLPTDSRGRGCPPRWFTPRCMNSRSSPQLSFHLAAEVSAPLVETAAGWSRRTKFAITVLLQWSLGAEVDWASLLAGRAVVVVVVVVVWLWSKLRLRLRLRSRHRPFFVAIAEVSAEDQLKG